MLASTGAYGTSNMATAPNAVPTRTLVVDRAVRYKLQRKRLNPPRRGSGGRCAPHPRTCRARISRSLAAMLFSNASKRRRNIEGSAARRASRSARSTSSSTAALTAASFTAFSSCWCCKAERRPPLAYVSVLTVIMAAQGGLAPVGASSRAVAALGRRRPAGRSEWTRASAWLSLSDATVGGGSGSGLERCRLWRQRRWEHVTR